MPERRSHRPVLLRLLEAAGYHVESRPGGLRATRLVDHRILFLVQGMRSPAELEGEFPAESVHRILVYSEDPGPVAREQAAGRGIEILEPSSLGPALGEILLPPNELASVTSGGVPTDGPLAPPAVMFGESERTVRPRLGREDAERIAEVEGFRYTLRLVPYYVFPCRVRLVSPSGGPRPVAEELAAVQAISGRVEIWLPEERELVTEIDEPHQRLEPLLPEERATELAREAIRKHHTIRVDHTEQHGGAIVIERRRVAPESDDLAFAGPVLLHAPFWYVEGATGRVVIDAVTGTRRSPETGEATSES
jgi:hypothetical protein